MIGKGDFFCPYLPIQKVYFPTQEIQEALPYCIL